MNYVRVIDRGHTYSSIGDGGYDNATLFGASTIERSLPINNKIYQVIKESYHPHPALTHQTILTIVDEDYRAWVVGIEGVQEVSEEDYLFEYDDMPPESESVGEVKTEPIAVRPSRRVQINPIDDNSYEVGDILTVIDRESSYYGKKLRVTDPHYRGYDVVTGLNETSTIKSTGFRFSQVKKFIPEPEILPENKPKFSVNELLEVLNQKKSAEEIILDLMDHITN